MQRLALALVLALPTAAAAQGLPPLSADRHVTDSLVGARVADRIRRECPRIDARMVRAFAEARALKRYAERKGYSEAAIEAFLDDKAERARIYALAEAQLRRAGARDGNADSFCRAGETEIAGQTIAGKLLVTK